jgi:hypothetical protein
MIELLKAVLAVLEVISSYSNFFKLIDSRI